MADVSDTSTRPNRVLISYAQESAKHRARIRKLADQLRLDGIDAMIDQYEPHPAEGWLLWMERQLRDSDFVLVAITETYWKRADGHEKPGIGLGVAWEADLITEALYTTSHHNTKFIPILFHIEDKKFLLDRLKSSTWHLLDEHNLDVHAEGNGYRSLYLQLTGQLAIVEPPVGKVPIPTNSEHEMPLVFVSASHKDNSWRERLKVEVDKHDNLVEWWDDTKIKAGKRWREEIDAAIVRARVAVVLLSPEYLASSTTIAELTQLAERATTGNLTLLPIVLYPCDWENVSAVREIQVWSWGKPINDLSDVVVGGELEKIAKHVVELAYDDRSNRQAANNRSGAPDSEFHFSKSAEAVLKRAKALAEQSHRTGVTSSCVLFAFADLAGTQTDTAQFVRKAFDRTGGYEQAFAAFLKDSVSGAEQSRQDGGRWLGKVSTNLRAVLEHAAEISRQVSPTNSSEIHQRHLFAALLVTREIEMPLIARKRLKGLGIEIVQLCEEFADFVGRTVSGENLEQWLSILTPNATRTHKPRTPVDEFLAGPSGYSSEFCGVGGLRPVVDHLGVEALANQLAELIALRETKLPLAIGLFGNWGSGKSHFMNLMDRRLKEVSEQEKNKSDGTQPKWCREIVPIYFNAWHYLDSNLWASLISQIFESLFAHLRSKNDDETMQKLLEQASGATARAKEEVLIAHTVTKQAENELQVAEKFRSENQNKFDSLFFGLPNLLPPGTYEAMQQHVLELLNLKTGLKSIDELRSVVEDSRSLIGHMKAFWNTLWNPIGRKWRLGCLIAIACVTGLTPFAAGFVNDALHGLGQWIASALIGVSSLATWIGWINIKVKRSLDKVEQWAKQADKAHATATESEDFKAAKSKVILATSRLEAARIRLAESQEAEKKLMTEAENLAPERRIGRFIEQRAQSADYRGQLGLVSLARRDFQELSDIFADAETLTGKLAKLRLTEAKKSEADELEKLSKSIDRIVLFVDDLDRCHPEKVVEILQAVHLLLAFPLFAVIVGVDQRCLRQSLRMQFKGLMTQDEGAEIKKNGTGTRIENSAKEEPQATPLDYLEKIFHVPFHLPPMGEEGFSTLIERLTEPPKNTISTPLNDGANDGKSSELRPKSSQTEVRSRPSGSGENSASSESKSIAPVLDKAVQSKSTVVDVVGSVPLHSWERNALKDYHSLIVTPRAATRLLNTYRLVRAGVPADEWKDFCGDTAKDGEFRLAMWLLASAAGYPAVARDWFELLRSEPLATVFQRDDLITNNRAAWLCFKNVHNETFSSPRLITRDLITKWIDRVERFAF